MNILHFYNKSAFYFTNITHSCSNIWKVEQSLESQIKLPSSSALLLLMYWCAPFRSFLCKHTHAHTLWVCTFWWVHTPGLAVWGNRRWSVMGTFP